MSKLKDNIDLFKLNKLQLIKKNKFIGTSCRRTGRYYQR